MYFIVSLIKSHDNDWCKIKIIQYKMSEKKEQQSAIYGQRLNKVSLFPLKFLCI